MNEFRYYIQVLRAISILSVLLFHFYNVFPLGYLGVDLFFIISGFLVGGRVINDVNSNKFSFSFYYKRILRIIPNQIFYIVLFFSYILLSNYPNAISKPIYEEIENATLFISNIHYWKMAGYFDQDSVFKPLLHMWSLAIEEQFYFVFPIVVLLFHKLLRRLDVLIFVLFVSSFVLNLSKFSDSTKFFLFPFRMWEFLIGIIIFKWKEKSLYFLSILVPFCFFGENVFQMVIVLIFGIIFRFLECNKLSLDKYLNISIIQFIGNISYSLYLSHWLVFFILNTRFGHLDRGILFCVYLVLCFSISFFTYIFIERKIYYNKHKRLIVVFPLVCLIVIQVSANKGISIQNRLFNSSYIKMKNNKNYTTKDTIIKLHTQGSELYVVSQFVNSSLPTLLIWGDSHTGNINLDGLDLFFNVIKISTPGCPPLFSTFRNEPIGNSNNCNCASKEDRLILRKYISNLKFQAVALTGRWSMYLDGFQVEGKLHRPHTHFIVDSTLLKLNYSQRKKLFAVSLLETCNYFRTRGKSIIIIKQTPDLSHYKNAKKMYWEGTYEIPFNHTNTTKYIDSVFRNSEDTNVLFLDLNNGLVNNESNILVYKEIGNCLTYKDDNHLSKEGGNIVGSNLIKNLLYYRIFKKTMN